MRRQSNHKQEALQGKSDGRLLIFGFISVAKNTLFKGSSNILSWEGPKNLRPFCCEADFVNQGRSSLADSQRISDSLTPFHAFSFKVWRSKVTPSWKHWLVRARLKRPWQVVRLHPKVPGKCQPQVMACTLGIGIVMLVLPPQLFLYAEVLKLA